MYRLLTNLSWAALGIVLCASAHAQSRDQPIQIEANKAEYSDRTGVSTYDGNVVLTQGGMVLRGNTLVVTRNKKSGNIDAVLTGGPATLEKPADQDSEQPVDGRAKRMEYRSGEAVVILTGDAFVKRGGDAIRGETIEHNLNSARTQARSAEDGGRVKITIQPDSAGEVAAPSAASPEAEVESTEDYEQ